MRLSKMLVGVCLSLLFVSQLSFAGGNEPSAALKTIATVTNYLNHYPEDSEKAKLKKILDNANAPAYEKALASALINMQHSVSSSDKKKLMAIANDSSVPQAARDIASVVQGLNHKASSSDRAVLKKYMW